MGKRGLRCLALVTVLVAGAAVCVPAFASDYGCKVLLCLANPSGPTAVSQCVPPINQLWQDLARLHPFPTCDEANTPGNSARAQLASSWYDVCPEGTTALENATYAVQRGADMTNPLVGIGTGDGLQPDPQNGGGLPRKVCVGQQTAHIDIWVGDIQNGGYVPTGVYDRVVVLDPGSSDRVIDVYLNDALYRRVRW